MITYLSKKTGERYPVFGCFGSFNIEGWSWSKGKAEHFIRPGYKDCTNGWKKMKVKDWVKEEIPDLKKPFNKEEFKEYATKYGLTCAQEFLECCDYMKPREAWCMFNPAKNADLWESNEIQNWFEKTFKTRLFDYIEGFSWSIANTYTIDIVKFEKYLHWEFNYNPESNESIHNFMIKTFGEEDTEKFKLFFFPPPEGIVIN